MCAISGVTYFSFSSTFALILTYLIVFSQTLLRVQVDTDQSEEVPPGPIQNNSIFSVVSNNHANANVRKSIFIGIFRLRSPPPHCHFTKYGLVIICQ